jgi:Predicted nucleotide-binding protein containing TIR-like domain
MKRRIYISMPADEWLTNKQNDLKWAIVNEIKKLGYVPEVFSLGSKYISGSIAAAKAWSPDEALSIARQCSAGIIIGLPRWTFNVNKKQISFASDFCQYEAALFKALNLPVLIVSQNDIEQRVVFNYNYGQTIQHFTASDDALWLKSINFLSVFDYFKTELFKRRDIFLGYCSSSAATAQKIKEYLLTKKVSIKDWQTDFAPGQTILQQISVAEKTCSGGIFLFTKDDQVFDSKNSKKAVPRDNVVFEAGFFMNAKPANRVLIVLEKGAKMPADLGGNIYASLDKKLNITPVKPVLDSFIKNF